MTVETTERGTAGLGRKTTRDDDIEQSREALPKNLIRPLPVQDRKSEWFRRPALPFVGARRRSGWSRLRRRRKQREEAKTLARFDGVICMEPIHVFI